MKTNIRFSFFEYSKTCKSAVYFPNIISFFWCFSLSKHPHFASSSDAVGSGEGCQYFEAYNNLVRVLVIRHDRHIIYPSTSITERCLMNKTTMTVVCERFNDDTNVSGNLHALKPPLMWPIFCVSDAEYFYYKETLWWTDGCRTNLYILFEISEVSEAGFDTDQGYVCFMESLKIFSQYCKPF